MTDRGARAPLYGSTMDVPLLVSEMIEHAAANHPLREVVARRLDGSIHRYDWLTLRNRSLRLASALVRRGIALSDRVGSLAWNTHEHLELFYGVSGMGAVLHTINPRLFEDQIAFIAADAGDRMIFIDAATLPIALRLAGVLPAVTAWVFMGPREQLGAAALPGLLVYDELLAEGEAGFCWPSFDERLASTICYTSGTTGVPKGVVYSHRAATLSAMCMSLADMIGGYRAGEVETVMPIAALFHGNGWQMPYSAPMNGHRLVLPGRAFEPPALLELIRGEAVTVAAAVPTVWLTLVEHLARNGGDFGRLRAALVAGSRPPPALVDTLKDYGLQVSQTWGMTEALGVTKASIAPGATDHAGHTPLAQRQGRTNFLVRMRLLDDAGAPLPHDGQAVGRLMVRGPYVAGAYLNQQAPAWDWLDTGDLARLFPDGSVEIVDRSKDVIKSGGEWISSLQLEAAACGHPAVLQAAAVGVSHPKWQERPVLAVVLRAGEALTEHALKDFMARSLARWWLPDRILFVDALPATGTGKVDKRQVRALVANATGPAR